MNNMRGNEQLIQLSRLQATGGGVLSLANAKSLEKPRNLLAPKEEIEIPNIVNSYRIIVSRLKIRSVGGRGWILSDGPCCSSCRVDFRSVIYCRISIYLGCAEPI